MGNEHWRKTTLLEIVKHPQYGWTSKADIKGKYKYFRTTDIKTPVNWDSVPYCFVLPQDPDKYTLKKNDLLVSRAGSVGLSIRINEDYPNVIFASYLIRIRPLECVLPKILEYYFQSHEYWSYISKTQTGIAVPNVNATKLSELPFLLPPIEEQQQIVEKLDAILPKVKIVKERLDKIPVLLKKFRQSILSSACSGKFTEDWREKNSIEFKWEKSTLKEASYKISTGPFGTMLHNSDYINNGVPVINPINIKNNQIIPDYNFCVSEDMANGLSKYKLEKNDIILARRGDLSKCGIVSDTEINWIAGTGTFFLRTHMNPFYFRMNYQSSNTQNILNHNSIGSTMPNLNQGILGKIEILLPSLKEQNEIVTRVDKLFALADSLEAKYKKAMERIEKIEQSILAKAFRGELVDAPK